MKALPKNLSLTSIFELYLKPVAILILLSLCTGSLYATTVAVTVANQPTSMDALLLPDNTNAEDEWDDDGWGDETDQSSDDQLAEYAKLDPYGGFNQAMFKLNNNLDKAILLPVAKVYRAILPGFARQGIRNVFVNLDETITIYNSVLQVKPLHFITSVSRLVINTTLGIGGLFDVATRMGIKRKKLDWGQTLHRWGWKNSSFFVVPFMGPSTVRDFTGTFVGFYSSPSTLLYDDLDHQAGYTALDFISLRENLIGITSLASTYELQRDLWLSQRKIFLSGQTGLDAFDDFGDDDDDEGDWEDEDSDWEDEDSDLEDEQTPATDAEQWLQRKNQTSPYASLEFTNHAVFVGPSSAFGLPAVRLFSNHRLPLWLAKEVTGYATNKLMQIPSNIVLEPISIEFEALSDIIDVPFQTDDIESASI